MQITGVKIQMQNSKGLNCGQFCAKHVQRYTQNDCHQWLSDSSRVHQIRFRPGLSPDPAGSAYDASPDALVGWGPIPHPPLLDAERLLPDTEGVGVFVQPHFQKSGYATVFIVVFLVGNVTDCDVSVFFLDFSVFLCATAYTL